MTVCSCHITYDFQSEFTLYSCMNVKELLARVRREIWRLNDCNWTQTQNHLVRKRTLNHLAKLAKWWSCVLSAYLYNAFDCKYSKHSSITWPVWPNGSVFIYKLSGSGFEASYSYLTFRFSTSKEFLDIQATIECGFTLKRVGDMTRTYSQMHRTDKYPEHSSIIWPVGPNGWVFVYKLSDSGFESSCSHLKSKSLAKNLKN